MTDLASTLSQGLELGGEGADAVVAGPYLCNAKITATIWHTGTGSGGGDSAWLRVAIDGGPVSEVTDANFNSYNLRLTKVIWLGAFSSVSVSKAFSNLHATVATHGLKLSVAPA